MKQAGLVLAAALALGVLLWLSPDETPLPSPVDVAVEDAAVADAAWPEVAGHRGWITALHVAGGRLLSGDADGVLVEWDIARRRPVRRFEARGGVRSIWTTAAGPGWGARHGVLREADGALLRLPSRYVNAAAPTSDGAVVAADQGWVGRLGAEATGRVSKPVWSVRAHERDALALALSPDGTRVASGGHDGQLRIGRTEDGAELLRIDAHDGWVTVVAWRGETLYSAGWDGRLRAWRPTTGERLLDVEAHARPIVALAVDERWLLTGSEDFTARLFRQDGAPVATIRGPELPVEAVALGAGHAFTGTRDGRPRMWQTDGMLVYAFPSAEAPSAP